jgi:hypothetical protein
MATDKKENYANFDISNNNYLFDDYKIDNTNLNSTIPFWTVDPNVLFRQEYIFEFFPTENMTYEQKLNALSRFVILITIISFLFSRSIRILIISLLTLASISMMYYYRDQEKKKDDKKKSGNIENFDNPTDELLKGLQKNINVFQDNTSDNPFSNVLMTDYDYNPTKKPAPPSYNENISANILEQAKNMVKESNPDQPDISDKLFKDLGEQYVFEQSLRQFNSTPNTIIPNDQQAFMDFCYGSMVSCKEGNLFACARNLARHTN